MDITIPSSSEKLTENPICDVYEIELNSVEDLLLNVEKGNESNVLRSESKEEFILDKTKEVARVASRTYFDSVEEKSGMACVVIDVTEQSHLHVEDWLNDDPCSGSEVLKTDSDEEIRQGFEQSKAEIKEIQSASTTCVASNVNINHIVNNVLEKLLTRVEDLLVSVEQTDELPKSDDPRDFQDMSLEEMQTTSQTFFDALEEPADLDFDFENSGVENSPVNLTAVNPLPDVITLEDIGSQEASDSRESLLVDSSDTDDDQETVAQPSEEIGDRDELDDMDDMDFVERMRIDDGNDELIIHRPYLSDILQSSDPELQDRVDSLSDSEDDVFVDVENDGEYEMVENIDFIERMMYFFREANTVIRSSHGGGDHTWIEPEEEEAD